MFTLTPETAFQARHPAGLPATEAVKWRRPSVLGAPNPVFVLQAGSTVQFAGVTAGAGDVCRLVFGPALPRISADGLDVVVELAAEGLPAAARLLEQVVTNDSGWTELWLPIPGDLAGKPCTLSVACGPGPSHDPRADWLALAECAVGARREISLARARADKELRTRNEIANFSRTYRMPIFTTKAKRNAFAFVQEIIRSECIPDQIDMAAEARRVCSKPGARILSVCCGAARTERGLFEGVAHRPHLTLVDINQDLLDMAAESLREVAEVDTLCADANEVELPRGCYDAALCVAGLHHIVELEHLVGELAGCLRPGGEFWSIDEYVGRNGARLWPESYELANAVFARLPEKYRVNHVSVKDPKPVDANLLNVDCSVSTFEGIRAEEVAQVIEEHFEPRRVNRWSTIAWRIIGPAYADNYDLDDPQDMATVEAIARADAAAFTSGRLRPVELRGIYTPRLRPVPGA